MSPAKAILGKNAYKKGSVTFCAAPLPPPLQQMPQKLQSATNHAISRIKFRQRRRKILQNRKEHWFCSICRGVCDTGRQRRSDLLQNIGFYGKLNNFLSPFRRQFFWRQHLLHAATKAQILTRHTVLCSAFIWASLSRQAMSPT